MTTKRTGTRALAIGLLAGTLTIGGPVALAGCAAAGSGEQSDGTTDTGGEQESGEEGSREGELPDNHNREPGQDEGDQQDPD